MREIDVHDFHRNVILDGEPEFAGLRAAAAVVTGDMARTSLGDWSVWNKLPGAAMRGTFTDWGVWNKTR